MRNLDSDLLVLGMGEFDNTLESVLSFYEFVAPDSDVLGGDAAFRDDGSCFDHCNAGSAGDDTSEVGHVPGRHVAILGGVLTEGRKHNAVLEGQASDLQGLEKLWDRAAIGLRV